jgi:hypothetical protein
MYRAAPASLTRFTPMAALHRSRLHCTDPQLRALKLENPRRFPRPIRSADRICLV